MVSIIPGLTHLCQVDSFTISLWTSPFPVKGVSGKFLLLPWVTEIPVLNANSVDPDQMLHSATSDLGLQCLPVSLLSDTRLKGIKPSMVLLLTIPRYVVAVCSRKLYGTAHVTWNSTRSLHNMLETHCFQWISNLFDNLFMLSNENGSTNTLARSYYVNLKKKEENQYPLNSLTKEEKSWVRFVAIKPNRK